ncbi:MAG: acyl carrier protein [Bacteroidales bacterium]|nr:acyl carrier protein [Bacteroidales bacterium]
MNIAEIKQNVQAYISENTFASKDKITESTLVFKEGFLDSMGLVMLITFLEEKFGIETTDADMVEENFESINAISEFVSKKLA